jgi:hypothetical protein
MEHCTPNDYTLEIKRLPKNVTEEQVKHRFSRLANGRPVEVQKVNFAYKIGDFIQAIQEKNTNERIIRLELNKRSPNR